MGKNLYTDLWENMLDDINHLLQKGGGELQLNASDFDQRGNRIRYTFRLQITSGSIPIHTGSAVARDLKTVLDGSRTFKNYATGKSIIIRLSSSFVLQVRVTQPA